MNATLTAPVPLVLAAETAADMMVPNLVSLRADASIRAALDLFTHRGISGAPVIDEAGHPIGVLSRSDILIHERESALMADPKAEMFFGTDWPLKADEAMPTLTRFDEVRVRDLMTPAVFSVRIDTPAGKVVSEMLALHVHRLFVVDDTGILVGVVSALDVLKHLRP